MIAVCDRLNDPGIIRHLREGRGLNAFFVYVLATRPHFRGLFADIVATWIEACGKADYEVLSRWQMGTIGATVLLECLDWMRPHLHQGTNAE